MPGLTMMEIENSLARTTAIMEELAEARRETEKAFKRMSERVDRVTKQVGGLNNSIGQLVQMVVLPGIMGKMNALGHTFTMATPEKDYFRMDGSNLTDVDLLLENSREIMVVEVKTTVTPGDFDYHLKRLGILRENEEVTGVAGKTIYAAVAGLRFKGRVRDLVTENGMYLIEIEENEDSINIVPPREPGKW